MKKLSFLLAIILVLSAFSMAACKKNDEIEETTTEETTAPEEPLPPTSIPMEQLEQYEIIYPRKGYSEDFPVTEVSRLFEAIKEAFDVKELQLRSRSDLYYEGVESLKKGQYEILIGNTNRDESATFIANLKWDDYGYGMVGDKLVIAGKNEDGTIAALRAFVEHIKASASEDKSVFFNNTDKLLVKKDYPHQSLAINGISVSELSILCNEEALGGVAQIIRQAIIDACGVAVPIVTDKDVESLENTILVGDTKYVSVDRMDGTTYPTGSEYYIHCADVVARGWIWLEAQTASGYLSAATDLATQISSSESDNVVIESGKREGSDNIAVMSFNLMAGKESSRVESIVETILKYRPAVVGVQEATDTWIGLLKQRLGDTYTIVGEGRGSDGNEYSAILYLTKEFDLLDSGTKWLSETPDQKGSKLPDSYYVRIMTYVHLERKSDHKQFLHANTHLDYTVYPEDEATQVAQMQILFDELAKLNLGDIPTIITGDFNAKADSLVYKMITDAGYIDSCPEAELQSPTYHAIMGTTGEPRHIDFIFTKGLANDSFYRICTERVDNENVSDHYPILSILYFQAKES